MDNIEFILPPIADGKDKSSPFANSIRKNYRHIKKWAKRTLTNSFRIYDREVPHYPVAIDFYGGKYCVHYFSRTRDILDPPESLVEEVVSVLQKILNVDSSTIYWRTRAKNKETRQYEKMGSSRAFFNVLEYGLKFKVNLEDYLDTGLFLDHRETRRLVASECKNKRLLNLFAYTCSFSVHAAAAGAIFTKSVDMSNTYTLWGRDNFILNGFCSDDHVIVRADCLKFLDQEMKTTQRYDVIVIDPPTISRSTKMEQLFDIQQDYIALITKALLLLDVGGILFFSTNARKFYLDKSYFKEWKIQEISHRTVCVDFPDGKMHRCWKFS